MSASEEAEEYEEEIRKLEAAVEELTEAIRLTAEYIGIENLPPLPGWSWFDALVKYAPEKAANFQRERVLWVLDTAQVLTEGERKEIKEVWLRERADSPLQSTPEVQP
jgi:hypothetical protein